MEIPIYILNKMEISDSHFKLSFFLKRVSIVECIIYVYIYYYYYIITRVSCL